MKTDETNPADWFMLAQERLEKADALYKQFGASYTGVELLQEALERYLKGHLIGKGWSLQKIHNLSTLLDAAVERDSRFKSFADLCEGLTAQYWEQHYPGGDLADVGKDYDVLRLQAGEMIALILATVPSGR
jgi:HEPN domain-containing protein